MKVSLDENGFDRNPRYLSPSCWYYEERDGLRIYQTGVGVIGVIKWRSLRASVARADKALRRKKSKEPARKIKSKKAEK